ncbi:S8 family serine peptidase [Wenzhouxiangella limi]|uniref:S8 family serine peptidase n=1 Tax=Wenzhouxiangella limi TaxID=2707351 RepID=UPI001945185C|nr:S8 family serine peptidase [Wenzhouxiangella limi]
MVLAGIESSQAVGQPDAFGSRWIVELEEAPTLEFAGQGAALEQGAGPTLPMLEATAPAVTGRSFDALDPSVQVYEGFLQQRQAEFMEQAQIMLGRKLAKAGSTQHVANAVILQGISGAEAQRLAELPGVRSIERESLYRLQLSDGPALIGARALAEGVAQLPPARGEGTVVGIIDSGINWNHRAFSANPTYSGGYEYSNPFAEFLGLCDRANVPCNDKLVGVYDFTSESTDGEDTDGHGTHVAAIAAGNEWLPDEGGVAPRAHIVSYRVCTEQDPDDDESGTCQGSAILQALDQAVRDGVDVVNYSIGGDPFDPWRDGATRRGLNLLDAGIAFATSAGNSGPDQETVGSPAEAPWIFAVGSSTHRERNGRRVTISGVGEWFILYGTGPDLPVPSLSNEPLRAGDAVGGTLEACEAFPAKAFNGAVALLQRGNCLFADKVDNAAAAGAIAVIMINNVGGGPIGMAGLEDSTIPAGMVSLADGEEILLALQAAGGELPVSLPTARITIFSESLGDQISGFSARGPATNVPNVMKPNVVAPGDGIRAAYVPDSTSISRISGTSMASPHAAGSMALLRQLEPDWTPAMLYSALETTAETESVLAFGEPADIFDRGAGRIRVDRAARAGLYLPVTRSEFQAANPEFGGDPGALNLAGLINENCGQSCSFTRTVTAMRAGTWSASGEGEVGVSVTPSDFTLEPGESQELSITVTPAFFGSNELQQGAVVLTPPSLSPPPPGGNLATQRLQVGVRASTGEVDLPALLRIDAESNEGRTNLDLGFIDDLPEAVLQTSALVRPEVEQFNLPEDPDNGDPYDGSAGTRTFLVEVGEDALALWAETVASSATDIDLYVGRDANRDGQAQAREEQCFSITPDELERCIVENPAPGTWWIVVQNWDASAAQDSITLETAVIDAVHSDDLVVYGPGSHEAGLLAVGLSWSKPEMRRNERHLGLVSIAGGDGPADRVGSVPVVLERSRALVPETTVLVPGKTQPVVAPARGRHEAVFVDVPETAERLTIETKGDAAVDVSVRRVGFDAVRASAPETPAPAGAVLASGAAGGAPLVLSASALTPGRYFVELDNALSEEQVVEITASLQETGTIARQIGLWSPVGTPQNRRDEIAQGITWQTAGDGFIVWYSYDEDGLPLFYLGAAPVDETSSVWSADIDTYVAADGEQTAVRAGHVVVTMIDEDNMVFSWSVNGGQGSDIKQPVAPPTCPEVNGSSVSYTGHWYTPGRFEGGTSVVVSANSQAQIRYYYDLEGVGRWFLADDLQSTDPLAEELDVYDFRGFCPSCPPAPVSSEIVGAYARMFESENRGMETMEFVSRDPLNHRIQLELPIVKLSAPAVCRAD